MEHIAAAHEMVGETALDVMYDLRLFLLIRSLFHTGFPP